MDQNERRQTFFIPPWGDIKFSIFSDFGNFDLIKFNDKINFVI